MAGVAGLDGNAAPPPPRPQIRQQRPIVRPWSVTTACRLEPPAAALGPSPFAVGRIAARPARHFGFSSPLRVGRERQPEAPGRQRHRSLLVGAPSAPTPGGSLLPVLGRASFDRPPDGRSQFVVHAAGGPPVPPASYSRMARAARGGRSVADLPTANGDDLPTGGRRMRQPEQGASMPLVAPTANGDETTAGHAVAAGASWPSPRARVTSVNQV